VFNVSQGEAAKILLDNLKEDHPAMLANKKLKERNTMVAEGKFIAGVIGVGAGGGNVAHLLTEYGYDTAALNTAQADMQDINVNTKIVIKGIDGSGKDRTFSATEFKRYYKSFFEDDRIKKLLEQDIIYIIGTGGGGTGTIVSIMVAGFLRNEFPNKTIILVGLIGNIKEDLVSQRNMLAFLSDLENKAADCPYMLFDNNRVKGKYGDDVFAAVNHEAVSAIRLLTREFLVENARSNIDSRDYARLTSHGGMLSVISIDKLSISVTEERVDLTSRVRAAMENSTAIVTRDPDAYGFFMNAQHEVYSMIDTTFDDIQNMIGRPTAGLVFKHLQDSTGQGPEFGIIMAGMASPLDRFMMIERRIEEYENATEKSKLPPIDRTEGALKLAGDSKRSDTTGTGGGFLDVF
jgi:cell division GTPase FtsZ